TKMKKAHINFKRSMVFFSTAFVLSCLLSLAVISQCAQTSNQNSAPANTNASAPAKKVVPRGTGFSTPQKAVDALVGAAEKYDPAALARILGPGSKEIIDTGEPARDKERASQFAEQARTKESIVKDPKNRARM